MVAGMGGNLVLEMGGSSVVEKDSLVEEYCSYKEIGSRVVEALGSWVEEMDSCYLKFVGSYVGPVGRVADNNYFLREGGSCYLQIRCRRSKVAFVVGRYPKVRHNRVLTVYCSSGPKVRIPLAVAERLLFEWSSQSDNMFLWEADS